jgi:hypothetical protein
MSALQALALARCVGVEVSIDGNDLALNSSVQLRELQGLLIAYETSPFRCSKHLSADWLAEQLRQCARAGDPKAHSKCPGLLSLRRTVGASVPGRSAFVLGSVRRQWSFNMRPMAHRYFPLGP